MKNIGVAIRDKLVSRYLTKDTEIKQSKSSDINVLLNKVRIEKKKEKFENIIFVCLVATVIVVTGIIISL